MSKWGGSHTLPLTQQVRYPNIVTQRKPKLLGEQRRLVNVPHKRAGKQDMRNFDHK
jgi:hypothetical protein